MSKLTFLLCFAFLIAACSGSAEPTLLSQPEMDPSGVATAVVPTRTPTVLPSTEIPEGAGAIVAASAYDLARRQDLPVEQIELVAVQPTEWPDSGLGCPAEGYDYAQVITPGYEIMLRAEGMLYSYHTDQGNLLVLCLEDGPDGLPVIPILPDGEIMDGIPWLPAEPRRTPSSSGTEVVDPEPIY